MGIALPTTPLKPQVKAVDIGDLVGRGLGTHGRQEATATSGRDPNQGRQVPIHSTKTQDEVPRGGAGVLGPKSAQEWPAVPLLKRIHQEATVLAAAVAAGRELEKGRAERGETPGMPRRGIGFDGGLKRRGHRATQRGKEQIEMMGLNKNPLSMTK